MATMYELFPDPSTPLMERYWSNALPMTLGELKDHAENGSVEHIGQTIDFLEFLLVKSGLKEDEISPFYDDILDFKALCYSTRIGWDMAFFYSSEKSYPIIDREYDLEKIEELLEVLVSFAPDHLVVVKEEREDTIYETISAALLKDKVVALRKEMQATFESTLNEILKRAENYAANMNFQNVYYDLPLRWRMLNSELKHAQKYAKKLGRNIDLDVERIKELAQTTLGYGPTELQ